MSEIELVRLDLIKKASNESQKDYALRLKDARIASSIAQTAAFKAFGIDPEVSSNAKGRDGQDGPVKIEHKMLTTKVCFRRSQFTGDNRLCLPDDIKECCRVAYVVSDVSHETPFAIKLSQKTVWNWLGLGYIDPITGEMSRTTLISLAAPHDYDRLISGETLPLEILLRKASQRLNPATIAKRLKKKIDSYEKKSLGRIAEGRQQQERYEKLSAENSVPRLSHGDE